jgi:hypothetical protein
VNKKAAKCTLLIGLTCLILTTGSGCDGALDVIEEDPVSGEELVSVADAPSAVEAEQTITPADPADLDADYYIDYESGTIPIGNLPIGTRVVDPSWVWEFRLGFSYSNNDWPPVPPEIKPVTWIIVAKDHYENLDPHITLLTEELIGFYPFDDSNNRGHEKEFFGHNHWGESGTTNANNGLRPWLNSTGIHSGEGFYRAFSDSFKEAMLTTTVVNSEWQKGTAYSTQDKVFIPSTTELGDTAHFCTYRIGTVYPYFQGESNEKRISRQVQIIEQLEDELLQEYLQALIQTDVIVHGGETWNYWTRSPATYGGSHVRYVTENGDFYDYRNHSSDEFYGDFAFYGTKGVRPVLNFKSEILVTEIRN